MTKTLDRYLYTVQILKGQYHCVRAIDLVHYLGFSKPTVSSAIRQMREQNLIEVEPDGNLLFTPEGEKRVDLLSRRICFFQQKLTEAGVDPETALKDAVSFSWEMSEASFNAFQAMLSP